MSKPTELGMLLKKFVDTHVVTFKDNPRFLSVLKNLTTQDLRYELAPQQGIDGKRTVRVFGDKHNFMSLDYNQTWDVLKYDDIVDETMIVDTLEADEELEDQIIPGLYRLADGTLSMLLTIVDDPRWEGKRVVDACSISFAESSVTSPSTEHRVFEIESYLISGRLPFVIAKAKPDLDSIDYGLLRNIAGEAV